MRFHPLSEVTVPDVRCRARYFPVGGVDDHEPCPGGEKVRHVGVEDRIFGQVVNDIEGDSQVCGEKAGPVGEAGAVIQEEALRRVTGEAAFAQFDGGPGDIQAGIARVVGQRKLVSVTAAELDHRPDFVRSDEIIEERGLGLGGGMV